MNFFSTVTLEPQKMESMPIPGRVQISVDEAAAAAKRVFPNRERKWINIPNELKGVYQISLRRSRGGISEWFNKTYGESGVVIDQYSGQVLAIRDSKERFPVIVSRCPVGVPLR